MIGRTLILLFVCLAVFGSTQDDPIERKEFNIEFLIEPFEDRPGGDIGLSDYSFSGSSGSDEPPGRFFSGGDVADLVQMNVFPKQGGATGTSILFQTGVLRVVHRRSIIRKVETFLAFLRGRKGRQIVIDAVFVRVEPGVRDIEKILSTGDVVQSLRLTAYSGQRVHIKDVKQHLFLRDYDVQISSSEIMLDPVPDVCEIGGSLDVCPYIEPVGDTVSVLVRGTLSKWEGMEERVLRNKVIHGDKGDQSFMTEAKIQHPKVLTERFRTRVCVRSKKTVLVGRIRGEKTDLVLLLTPTIVALEEPRKRPARMGLYDLKSWIHPVRNFSTPEFQLTPPGMGGSPLSGATFTLDESPPARLGQESLVDLIRSQVAPGEWKGEGKSIELSAGDMIVIRHKEKVLSKIEDFLKARSKVLTRTITTEAILLGFRGKERKRWGTHVSADNVAGLLQEKDVRVIGRAEVTGLPGQRVVVSRLKERLYLQDMEPQISTNAGSYDPVIGTLRTGFALEVQPRFMSGGKRVSMKLRCSYIPPAEMRVLERVSSSIGYMHMPRIQPHLFQSEVVSDGDRYTVVSVKGNKVEQMVLLVRAQGRAVSK